MSSIIDQLLKLDANKIEMPKGTHKMYCKKLGQELEFEIEAIDAEKVAEIQEMAIDITKGEINSIDTYKLKVETIAAGCKMFKNKDLQKHFKAWAESLVAERNRQGVPDFYRLAVNRTGLPFGHAAQHSEYGLVHQRAPVLDNLDIRHAAVRLHNEACDYLHAVALVPGGLIILQLRLDIFHQYVLPADKLRLHEPVFPTAGHVYCGAVARAYGMAGFAPRRPPRHGGEHPQHGIVDAVSDRIYYARPRNGAVFLDDEAHLDGQRRYTPGRIAAIREIIVNIRCQSLAPAGEARPYVGLPQRHYPVRRAVTLSHRRHRDAARARAGSSTRQHYDGQDNKAKRTRASHGRTPKKTRCSHSRFFSFYPDTCKITHFRATPYHRCPPFNNNFTQPCVACGSARDGPSANLLDGT